jgi:hypothetical protein
MKDNWFKTVLQVEVAAMLGLLLLASGIALIKKSVITQHTFGTAISEIPYDRDDGSKWTTIRGKTCLQLSNGSVISCWVLEAPPGAVLPPPTPKNVYDRPAPAGAVPIP